MTYNDSTDMLKAAHNVNRQYQDALAELRKAVDIELPERRHIALELYDRAAAQQAQVVSSYVESRDKRISDLTAQLFTGGPDFNAAISRYATSDADALRRLAALAQRTDNNDLFRAAYTVAVELDDAKLLHELKGADPVLSDLAAELEALNAEAARRDPHPMLKSVRVRALDAPGGPTVRDIVPGREEIAAAQEAERQRAEAERRAAASKYARSIQGKKRRQVGSDVHHV